MLLPRKGQTKMIRIANLMPGSWNLVKIQTEGMELMFAWHCSLSKISSRKKINTMMAAAKRTLSKSTFKGQCFIKKENLTYVIILW